ncbi:hypothetical protein [Acidisphaera sp. S103]|uniref:hypothetical protein n=1 Tax=Acidisphaera sp. S103 TaxID=1747223 RepID=UPI00131B17D0|nr:hypothetical protein [Acidisphaera sp. S103]
MLGIDSPVHGQTAPPSPPWPHTLTINGNQVVVYQPQAIDWPDHGILSTREAIAITPPGQTTPILGTTEIDFATQTDAATGNVILSDPQLKASHFPALDTARAAQVEQQIKAALPDVHPQPVALQSVLLSLKDSGQPQNVAINNDPPAIFYSAKPASLVVFDGEPVLAPIGTTGLSSVVNTNWDVFTDGKDWYLLNNGLWMAAPAASGPYQPVAKLPPVFASLPADANFAGVRKEIPPKPAKPGQAPVVFVSTKPADIIVTNGPPQFVPVKGTGLQAVKNTTSTVFFEPTSGRYFVLVSGRWFASHGFDGPWTFATNDLPPDFALIPPNDPQAAVLASVPGTTQAQQALLQAQVPRQATLKKDAAKLTVVYAGPPQFKPIPGTPMTYAVNTSFQVIGLNGRYYVCHQGAWFEGPSPNGPWVLASSVPKEIYAIPPTSPMYNVTYVKVYGASPTTVTYGYTAGYMMGFVTAGVLVYGTGYYYPPVVIPGPVPVYYPYPYSYVGPVAYNTANGAWVQGGAVYGPYGGVAKGGTYYNPNNGAYGAGGAIYGPNGGAGAFSYYNPSTGGYAHGSASWSNGYGSANASYYNPRTGVSGSTNQNVNPYERYGSSTFSGPNQTVNTASGSNSRGSAGGFQSSTGAEGAGYRGANGNSGGAVKTQNGDVYAGHDGNAYKHTSDGWSKWDNGGWQQVNPPTNNNNNRNNNPGGSQSTNTSNRNNNLGGSQSTNTNNRNNNLGGSQSTSPSANRNAYTGQTSNQRTAQTQRSSRPSMENSSYQQLEQDRRARTAGNGQFGSFRGGGYGGGGYGGGRFGGGGGGRFRR